MAPSPEEAGLPLPAFDEFPRATGNGQRSTTTLGPFRREFGGRTKTQGSFSTEEAALALLFGLVAFGEIERRRITGAKHLAHLVATAAAAAA